MYSVRRKRNKMNSKFEKAVALSAPKDTACSGIVGSRQGTDLFPVRQRKRQKLEVEIARLRAENDAIRSALDVMEAHWPASSGIKLKRHRTDARLASTLIDNNPRALQIRCPDCKIAFSRC